MHLFLGGPFQRSRLLGCHADTLGDALKVLASGVDHTRVEGEAARSRWFGL